VQRHAQEHLDTLATEIESAAVAAAEQVDAEAEALLAAIGRCAQLERDLTQLVRLVRQPQPSDVSRLASDEVQRVIATFIAQGGERAPTLRREAQVA
jgi:hypothetical protein